jgi:TolA-binding protein
MLQQNPGQVREPLEMAELLFLSGRPTEAAPFYARALDQLNHTDPSYDADRAWVLFQWGNCLRETDTAKAQETYMKLVSEYPDSPWTELAKAHGRLLTWYEKSRPGQPAASPQL